MPNIKSAKKRVKTAERNRVRNVITKSSMRSAIKKVRVAIEAGNKDAAAAAMPAATKAIDIAVKRNVAHKNAAARYKSSLQTKINAL